MTDNKTTTHINLENLLAIARSSKEKMYIYLKQFSVLIRERSEKLRESLLSENRTAIRKILHNMSPQIQFFGVPGVVESIKKLELEYQSMPMPELKQLVEDILKKLNIALKEVEEIIKKNYLAE